MEKSKGISVTNSSSSIFNDAENRFRAMSFNCNNLSGLSQYFGQGLRKWRSGSFLLDIHFGAPLFGGNGNVNKGIIPRRKLHRNEPLKCLWMKENNVPKSIIDPVKQNNKLGDTDVDSCVNRKDGVFLYSYNTALNPEQNVPRLSEVVNNLVGTEQNNGESHVLFQRCNKGNTSEQDGKIHKENGPTEHRLKFSDLLPLRNTTVGNNKFKDDSDHSHHEHRLKLPDLIQIGSKSETNNRPYSENTVIEKTDILGSNCDASDNIAQNLSDNVTNESYKSNNNGQSCSEYTDFKQSERLDSNGRETDSYLHDVSGNITDETKLLTHIGNESNESNSCLINRNTIETSNTLETETLSTTANQDTEGIIETLENIYNENTSSEDRDYSNTGENAATDNVLIDDGAETVSADSEVENICHMYITVDDGFVTCRILTPSLEDEITTQVLQDDSNLDYLTIIDGKVCFKSHSSLDKNLVNVFDEEESFNINDLFVNMGEFDDDSFNITDLFERATSASLDSIMKESVVLNINPDGDTNSFKIADLFESATSDGPDSNKSIMTEDLVLNNNPDDDADSFNITDLFESATSNRSDSIVKEGLVLNTTSDADSLMPEVTLANNSSIEELFASATSDTEEFYTGVSFDIEDSFNLDLLFGNVSSDNSNTKNNTLDASMDAFGLQRLFYIDTMGYTDIS